MNTNEQLLNWAIEELNLVSDGFILSNEIPDIESLRTLTKGKNKKIWNYVTNHVRSQYSVHKIKRTLHMKRLLKESKDNSISSYGNNSDVVKLQSAVSKDTEERTYLMRTLSSFEGRIVHMEQKILETKDEVFQFNQKISLLELLKQKYAEKNLSGKVILFQISSHKKTLGAYQSSKVSDKTILTLPSDFLYDNKAVYNHNISRIEELINISASIYKKNTNEVNAENDSLIEIYQNNMGKLKETGVLLTEFVILLKEISGSDLQLIVSNLQNFVPNEKKEIPSTDLLMQLKCHNVYYSVNAIKHKKQSEKLVVAKEKMFNEKTQNVSIEPSDLNFEVNYTLFEKLAENEALAISNNFLEAYLKQLDDKTDVISKEMHSVISSNEKLSSVQNIFFSNVHVTRYLLHTASSTFKKVIDSWKDLQCTYDDIFELLFSRKDCLEDLKSCLVSDRKQTWNYCDKTNLFKPIFSDTCETDYSLSSEIQKSLNFQPFQNISFLCGDLTHLKQKLCADVIPYSEAYSYVKNDNLNISEMYAKIFKMLEKMKFSVEQGTLLCTDGMECCHKFKSKVQEWWEQNAQYIPNIEYEGKTLKMWIDIFSVLSD